MKKYRKFLFLFIIIIAVVLGVFLYTSVSKENTVSSEEKSLSEIEYLEKKLVTLLNQLNNVKKVEILPYHDMGKYKWKKLKLSYPLSNVPPATEADVKRAKNILEIE